MRNVWIVSALAAGLLLTGWLAIAVPGKSHKKSFKASLNGYQVVPAVSTNGHGQFQAEVDSEETSLTYTLEYSELEGTPFFADVHLGQPGVNGGSMFALCGGGGKPDCPANPAAVSAVIVIGDVEGPVGQGIDPSEFAEATRTLAQRRGKRRAAAMSLLSPTTAVWM